MDAATATCWICGATANSREHIIKASILKDMFPRTMFYNDESTKNKIVQSKKAKILKFDPVICHYCNSARTQIHDKAWDKFSKYAQKNDLTRIPSFRLNRVFPYDTRRYMRHVHLYFVKLFGCAICQYEIPIDLRSFSNAIINDMLHPNIYLSFGPKFGNLDNKTAVISPIYAVENDQGTVGAVWHHALNHMTIRIIYARDGYEFEGIKEAWHPRKARNVIIMLRLNASQSA